MSEERRTELLGIFINTFCKYGLDGTTTKKLAKEANLSEAGLYVYFKNKEEILLKCYEYHIKNVAQETEQMVKKLGNDPEKFILTMFTYIKTMINENRFVFQVMLHPHYSQLMKDERMNMLESLKINTETLQKYNFSTEAGTAIILLFNSTLNNYILTQDEDSFNTQMAFLLKLFR